MNMTDMKTTLKSFLSGDLSTETEAMLETMGFIKKGTEQPAAAIDTDAIKLEATKAGKAEGVAEGLATGRTEGRASAVADAKSILDMCALSGKLDKAASFITSGATVETVRAQLVDTKAEEQKGTEIKSAVSPLTTGDVNPVIAEAIKRRDANKK